ncbi:hypothetical protein GCM10011342_29930 [Aquisalinus flavus]|uniref:Uncharacterized protein n=1 Tax=Aquisalinus flavus TaxID=1526572 RepID=A0A8J2V7G2_9PROT|nr:hypothetical protein [Aquisalinus flavus]MBD0428028.1 hypothetical protein [Aquisalinus flavus]GGD19274.1 hypothetical protein GCM10011342_29930 [Aquisalinus flavus]
MKQYFSITLISAALALSACGQDSADNSVLAEGVATNGYTEYENERFGFLIGYAGSRFTLQDAPQNNDGRVLDGPEGSTLRVFGTNNALGLTFDEQIARASDSLSEILTQTRRDDSWYVEARDHDGQWVALKLIHAGPQRLVTARFTAAGEASDALRETGRIAVHSLQVRNDS